MGQVNTTPIDQQLHNNPLINPNYVMREYDEALAQIYVEGFDIDVERTGKGTRCKFGLSTKYDVSKRVPILTKRKVAYKSIIKENLWYITGSHSINDLEAMGCGIWTPWKNDAFTTKHGFPQGSGGYIYGYNLIHFGASIEQTVAYEADLTHWLEKHGTSYAELPLASAQTQHAFSKFVEEMNGRQCYSNRKGFNQLDYVINALKKNPADRQACFTFWRPDTNNRAILPACHAFYSFIASPDADGKLTILNCHVFQRSNDYPIGVGMGNILTATLFTYMIAQQVGMTPGMVYHTGSHCHIYHNAMEATAEYISRAEEPNSPILTLNKRDSIYDYEVDDFVISDYNPLPKIDFDIAV